MYRIGIDLGGTNIAVGIVDEKGNILYKDSIKTLCDQRTSEELVEEMAKFTVKVVSDAGFTMDDIISVGVGSPGTPDAKNGILLYANNLKMFNVPMRAIMQKYINKPIYLGNDANCAALGEVVAGGAKNTSSAIMITLGTGVGGGIVIDNKIYDGFNNAGGELGHFVMVVDGEQCSCGRKGCFEAYSSATALIKQTRKAAEENPGSLINDIVDKDLNKISGRTAFEAMKAGDETGKAVVDNYVRYLGEGIISLINIFQPEVFLIGGGISKEKEDLYEPLKEMVKNFGYNKDEFKQTKVMPAVLRNDAGIIGAAFLA